MGLSLRGTTSGAVDINAPAVAGDNTITLPNGNGSANQFFKNSDIAGIITHSSMTESSSGVISIGDIDIDGTTRTITTGVGQTVGFSTDIKIQGSVRIEDPSVSASRLAITYEGIDFQNTGAGSSTTATSHVLDDYEEGTFTPIYQPETGAFTSITYDSEVSGSYTKIGNICYVRIYLRTDALTVGTASGNLYVGGLPFTPDTTGKSTSLTVGFVSSWAGETPSVMITRTDGLAAGTLYYRTTADGSTSPSKVTDLNNTPNDNTLYISGFYNVD